MPVAFPRESAGMEEAQQTAMAPLCQLESWSAQRKSESRASWAPAPTSLCLCQHVTCCLTLTQLYSSLWETVPKCSPLKLLPNGNLFGHCAKKINECSYNFTSQSIRQETLFKSILIEDGRARTFSSFLFVLFSGFGVYYPQLQPNFWCHCRETKKVRSLTVSAVSWLVLAGLVLLWLVQLCSQLHVTRGKKTVVHLPLLS